MSSSTVAPTRTDSRGPAGRPKAAPSPLRQSLAALASLRLTVVLFALALLLVFVGTLAQMNESNWTVVGKYFRSWFVWVPFQLFIQVGQVFVGVPTSVRLAETWGFPFPGGWTIGSLLLANLLAAHALRFKLTWKRAGILVLHAGLIVLLLGELLTGLFSVESRMTLAEGETANFLDVSRTGLGINQVELAITDSSDPQADDVVAVPGSLLRRHKGGGVIRDDNMPVDVEVLEYLPNSDLVQLRGDGPPKRDVFVSSVGLKFAVRPVAEGAGVQTEQREDAAAARVRLVKKGTNEEVGTFLVSLWFYRNFTLRLPVYRFPPQQFDLDGKTYTIELRPKREYLPYALHLIEFRHDKFVGTDTPKNYSSLVRVSDAGRGEDKPVLISMNHPLRRFTHGGLPGSWLFNGETFFQSSFLPPKAGVKGTVLTVVRNPGWLMPYLSCALVTLGMAVHFGIHLFGFLKRRAAP
jgi:hypothetical protein